MRILKNKDNAFPNINAFSISLICVFIKNVVCDSEIILELDSSASNNLIKRIELKYGFIYKRKLFDDYHVFTGKSDARDENISKRGLPHIEIQFDHDVKFFERQPKLEIQKRAFLFDKENELSDLRRGTGITQKKRCKRGIYYPKFNDIRFPDQWYIYNEGQNGENCGNDLNILPVWEAGFTGNGIVVSVLDDGIQHSHPDLIDNYDPLASFDINDNDNDPTPNTTNPDNNHGTECAGEIAATANNSVCGVGIAFNAKIGGIRVLDGSITGRTESDALLYANDYIDIYSASWGPPDNGRAMELPPKIAHIALKKGTKEGRRGKGSIYVWATGNGGHRNDTCSCDGYASSIFTISIGSITENGQKSYFSEECASTMAVVYTGSVSKTSIKQPDIDVITTDVDGKCTSAFQGTSSAAPLAAGIFALVLEANPNLSWRDMQHLIVETSKITNINEDGWQQNGAGYYFNHKFGAGVLDANEMVKQGQKWINVSPQLEDDISCSPNIIFAVNANFEQMKCQTKELSYKGFIRRLEHVELHLNITTKRRGGLSIDLYSPSGTHSRILEYRKNDDGHNLTFTFMTIHNWGEDPSGEWQIKICTLDTLDNTTINHIQLIFYGTNKTSENVVSMKARQINSDELLDIKFNQNQREKLSQFRSSKLRGKKTLFSRSEKKKNLLPYTSLFTALNYKKRNMFK